MRGCLAGCERCSAKSRSASEKNHCQKQEEIDTDRFGTWSW